MQGMQKLLQTQLKNFQELVQKQRTLDGYPLSNKLGKEIKLKMFLLNLINPPYNLKLRRLIRKLRLGLKRTNGLEMIKQ